MRMTVPPALADFPTGDPSGLTWYNFSIEWLSTEET